MWSSRLTFVETSNRACSPFYILAVTAKHTVLSNQIFAAAFCLTCIQEQPSTVQGRLKNKYFSMQGSTISERELLFGRFPVFPFCPSGKSNM